MKDKPGAEYVLRSAPNGYPLDRIQMNRSRSWDVFVDEQHIATARTREAARALAEGGENR